MPIIDLKGQRLYGKGQKKSIKIIDKESYFDMAFFRHELAIDLGTANTVIFKDDQVVLDEPSIIALESKTDALYAIGKEAQQIEEHTPPGLYTIRPLMNEVIEDYDAAEDPLKQLPEEPALP